MAVRIKLMKVEGKYKKFALPLESIDDFVDLRRNAEKNVIAVRSGKKERKRMLPQVVFSMNSYTREPVLLETLETQNEYFVTDMDFENREEAMRIAEEIKLRKEELGIQLCAYSVNYGLHLCGKRLEGTTILENQVRLAKALRTEMDTNAHDAHRVLYQTLPEDIVFCDGDLFVTSMTEEDAKKEYAYLKRREVEGKEELPKNAHQSNKHYRPWEDTESQEIPVVVRQGVMKESRLETECCNQSADEIPTYYGIPYSEIVRRYWNLFNEGREPIEGNRNVLVFELARQIRGITNFDRALLDKIIPNYDGFDEGEKMQCIDRALSYPMSFMPTKLRQVLDTLKSDEEIGSTASALIAAQEEFEQVYLNRLDIKKLAQSVQGSLESLSPLMTMPVLTLLGPLIGGIATGIKLECHGELKNLNLSSFICGLAGSGKSGMDKIYRLWCEELLRADDVYEAQEDEWEQKKREAEGSDKQPKEIRLPKRMQTARTTLPKIMQRFRDSKGKHLITYSPEADVLSENVQAYKVLKLLLRVAYDGAEFSSDVKSVNSTNTRIKNVLWNVSLCGTPDALYRLVQQQNLTDGLLSRMSIASMPDNTYKKLERKHKKRSERACNKIRRVAHLLMYMHGDLCLDKLEDWSVEWVNEIAEHADKMHDESMARLRIRTCVSAMRYTCCFMLCSFAEWLLKNIDDRGNKPLPNWADNCTTAEEYLRLHPKAAEEHMMRFQTISMQDLFRTLADYFLDNSLYYFRTRIEKLKTESAYALEKRTVHRGANDDLFESLQKQFTQEECVILRNGNENAARCMIRSWEHRHMIRELKGGERPKNASRKSKYYVKL